MRFAIYYTPPEDHPLTATAERWLQRSAFSRKDIGPLAVAGFSAAEIAELTAEPRRYGFHATMKAPFRLAEGAREDEVRAELEELAVSKRTIPQKMKVARFGRFFAIIPDGPSPELNELAAEVVRRFERFRAPLTEAEFQRREPAKLSPSQLQNLRTWGYPHVQKDFHFHMTLTGKVPEGKSDKMQAALETIFNPVLEDPLDIGGLALFVQPGPDLPFHVDAMHAFAAREGVA